VVLKIGAQNFRSQRAAQKIGAARVGVEPRPDGGESVIYEVTAETLRV
jgi:RimJ/RimL family protein N-acetyltransferase